MSLSLILWQELPDRLLKMGYGTWAKLGDHIQMLVVDLAKEQKFKCAFCSATRRLVIDHDHGPEEGPGELYTVYNIRGLVCRRCNWHLGLYEKDERGECRDSWHHVDCRIPRREYEDYIFRYTCRISPLLEECAWGSGTTGAEEIS